MEEQFKKLSEIYYNPKTGFVGLKKLQHIASKNRIRLTNEEISKWYKEQPVNQIFKSNNKYLKHNTQIYTPKIGYLYADLIDMSKHYKANKGYKWILGIIDGYSRYAWTFPTKRKTPDEVLPGIKKVLQEVSKKAENTTLTIDDGGEFKGVVGRYLNDLDVQSYIANPNNNTKNRNALIERFNRTLIKKIFRAMYSRGNTTWLDILPDLTENYNNSVHSVTKMTPKEVFLGGKKSKQKYIKKEMPIKVGDYVRLRLSSSRFDKPERSAKYSDEIYLVSGREGFRFELMKVPSSGVKEKEYFEPLDKLFSVDQLLKVQRPNKNKSRSTYTSTSKKESNQKRFKTLQKRTGLDIDDEGNFVIPRSGRRL